MRQVELKFTECGEYGSYYELVVSLDGEVIARGGYGGEPEDATRHRDYCWVETALTKLAERLGAEVSTMEVISDE